METVTIQIYASELLSSEDYDLDFIDSFEFADITVPYSWVMELINQDEYFEDYEHFNSTYTWDITQGWLDKAITDKVLLGITIGQY